MPLHSGYINVLGRTASTTDHHKRSRTRDIFILVGLLRRKYIAMRWSIRCGWMQPKMWNIARKERREAKLCLVEVEDKVVHRKQSVHGNREPIIIDHYGSRLWTHKTELTIFNVVFVFQTSWYTIQVQQSIQWSKKQFRSSLSTKMVIYKIITMRQTEKNTRKMVCIGGNRKMVWGNIFPSRFASE